MLTSWQIKNFKAWRDTGPLKLAPLTVILGANSVGKSSLGHLLTALKQTTLASHITQPVDFGDHHSLIDLGSFAQCLHQGVLSEPLSFELQWQLAEPLQLEHLDAQKPCVIDELSLAVSIIADQTQQPVLQTLRYRGYQQGQECVSVAYCSTRPHALQVQLAQPQRHSYQIALEEALAPERFYQLPTENALNAKFIQLFAQQTEAFFAGFHALKALRAMPQRRYVWDGETPANVGAIGELTVAALLAAQAQQRSVQFSDEHSEQGLQETVAQWLQQLGVASAFSVAPLADQPDTYQVLLNNHPQGTAVNLADLGFGVAQLLPVLVQVFYAPAPATLWLEQPETHLHPQVQAGLADLFIAAIQSSEKDQQRPVQIVTESHSEHFLNRLQRRIAEGVISHHDVVLYYCSREGTEAKIEALTVDTYGEIANWPEHLFGDEMSDIAGRAMAAVQRKRQLKNSALDDA